MSVIGSNVLAGASGQAAEEAGAYQISRSVRFNSSDSVFCSRTPASAGNRKTWTWAGWVKRSALGSNQALFGAFGSGIVQCIFTSSDVLRFQVFTGSNYVLDTTQVFRDCSAWYHIVVAFDSTQSTASDRTKLYVNGSQVTALTGSYAPQNTDGVWNNAIANNIGQTGESGYNYYLNGYLADIHFIDGQALTPSSFTEVSATTGQLIPKQYTGSFGTNGFWLKFSDNSNNTAATLGKDYSSNGNNWTPNNLSVTAGAGNDSLVDTPTNYGTDTGAGGEVRGNYCTLNPIDSRNINNGSGPFLTQGNLRLDGNATQAYGTINTPRSGKWYWEVAIGGGGLITVGFSEQNSSAGVGYFNNGNKRVNGVDSSYGASFTNGDLIGVAIDCDNSTATFYKNNASQGAISFPSGVSGAVAAVSYCGNGSDNVTYNFGQRPFAYTAPSGFKALCTTNLPDPLVAQPSTVMDVAKWSGDSAASRLIPLDFNPDFLWIKQRNASRSHHLTDTVRGLTKYLFSDQTLSEATSTNKVLSTSASGFTVGNDGATNFSGNTYVAWCWDAGSAASPTTNTDGSITSTVRANPTAGFSIVTYTGNGAAGATVGHGLGVTPSMILIKRRSVSGDWIVHHKSFSSLSDNYLNLNSTSGVLSASGLFSIGASTIGFPTTYNGTNQSTTTYVAYCFAPVDGYSSFGSYVGNGSSDGVFVYTGFRPAFVLLKASSASGNWIIEDYQLNNYNATGAFLIPNLANSQDSGGLIDFLSNGFKLRLSSPNFNGNGTTYIYAAFAESPQKYSRAR